MKSTVQGQANLNEILDQIEQRAEAATPGPWKRDTCSVIGRCDETARWGRRHVDGGYYGVICETDDYDDCRSLDFIAASRTDVPALVKALRFLLNEFREYHVSHPTLIQVGEEQVAAILTNSHDVREGTEAVEQGAPVATFQKGEDLGK